jgi:hypothetical protein
MVNPENLQAPSEFRKFLNAATMAGRYDPRHCRHKRVTDAKGFKTARRRFTYFLSRRKPWPRRPPIGQSGVRNAVISC